jgi:hypothetical protein
MRRALIIFTCLAATIAGCSSHEEKFAQTTQQESAAVVAARDASAAAGRLITKYRGRVTLLPIDVLAPLAQASAFEYEATGAPGVRQLATEYADAMLLERPLFSTAASTPVRPIKSAAVVDALIDVSQATGSSRYADAAAGAARVLASPRSGWTTIGGDTGIRGPRNSINIAATAAVAAALDRAARDVEAPVKSEARAGFKTVTGNQAALGRWWSYTKGEIATDLAAWATILDALAATPDEELQGIAGGGVPALANGVLDANGAVREKPAVLVSPLGLALSLELFQTFSSAKYASDAGPANRAFETLVDGGLRSDGTARFAPVDDDVTQATVAVALARRARDLSTGR